MHLKDPGFRYGRIEAFQTSWLRARRILVPTKPNSSLREERNGAHHTSGVQRALVQCRYRKPRARARMRPPSPSQHGEVPWAGACLAEGKGVLMNHGHGAPAAPPQRALSGRK